MSQWRQLSIVKALHYGPVAHLSLGHCRFHAREATQNHHRSRAEDRSAGPGLCAPASNHPALWDFTAHCGVPLDTRKGSKSRQRAAPVPRREVRCTLSQGRTVTSGKWNEGPLITSARSLCRLPKQCHTRSVCSHLQFAFSSTHSRPNTV